MNCSYCDNYNHGRGTKSCLRCKQYISILKASGKRKTIPIDTITDRILESVPDTKQKTAYQALQSMPLELSGPIILYFFAGASQREIAEYLNTNQANVSRKINFAIEIIKKTAIFGQ